MGERSIYCKIEVQELAGWDEDNLLAKAKTAHASKSKQEIHLLFSISRQMFSHFLESRAHQSKEKTNAITPNIPPLPSLPSFYCKAWHHILWEISLSSFWLAVLAAFHPSFLCTHSSSLTCLREKWEGSLGSVQALICNKIATYQLQWEKLILYQPKLGHMSVIS